MAAFEELSVSLPSDVADMVQDAVTSGAYTSTDEIVREALQEWTLRRAVESHGPDEIRRLWQEGIDSGPGRFSDIDAIKQEARKRLTRDMRPPR